MEKDKRHSVLARVMAWLVYFAWMKKFVFFFGRKLVLLPEVTFGLRIRDNVTMGGVCLRQRPVTALRSPTTIRLYEVMPTG